MTSKRAEELLLEYLDLKDKGDPIAFDAFCARHPEHAAELATLLRGWQLAHDAIAERQGGPSLAERIRAKLGDAAAADVTLPSVDSTVVEERTEAGLMSELKLRAPSSSRYQLRGEVAQGGMGMILRVWDEDLRRHLAMKVMLADENAGPRGLARFVEEAQVTGQLDHPGIVPVHELGIDARGRVFFTMKLVKGQTLGSVIDLASRDSEGWNRTRVLSVLLRVCEAMAFAHDKGVIHRDLKPGNVMVGKFGETYVMDWGLARVSGRKETKDIRIRPDATTSEVRTTRRENAGRDTPESPLITMDGDVVGTPAYMAPEQAQGDLERVGPQSDVYAIGAMLYHALTGRIPYVDPGARPHGRAILAMVLNGPPRPVHLCAPDAPAELVAICDKAMARSLAHRYRSMTELADDLRAYLENRVVKAHATGAVAELKKWVRRNRGFAGAAAAALVAVVAGAIVASRQGAEIRAKDAELALKSITSGAVLLANAITAEAELYPAWPESIPAMERWLAEDARRVSDLKPHLVSAIAELEARALPWTQEDRERDRTTHDEYPLLASLLAARAGPVAEISPPDEFTHWTADALNEFAWERVSSAPEERVHGEDQLALSVARASVQKANSGDGSVSVAMALDTLAWALVVNGHDDEARVTSARAVELANEKVRSIIADNQRLLEETIANRDADIENLESRVSRRRTWRFTRDDDQYLHDTFVRLRADIASFEEDVVAGVTWRLGWARRIGASSLHHPKARVSWQDARDAIAKADGVVASSLYRNVGIVLEPQMGLVPIGMNPVTRLWEFYDLRSASDPNKDPDPATIEIPSYAPDGSLAVGHATGIVFVLVPGGSFVPGVGRSDTETALQSVVLSPFFIARHEVTLWQWLRLGIPNDHLGDSMNYSLTLDRQSRIDARVLPLTRVTWEWSDRWLRRCGFALPTEAQWEFAARAGTSTAWWTGADASSLAAAANVLDVRAGAQHPDWVRDWGAPEGGFDDGFSGPAPVGRFSANPFGLFDVHGNVWEWCADPYAEYLADPRPGDGLRSPRIGEENHVIRGGGFRQPAANSRSDHRDYDEGSVGGEAVGIRAARPVMHSAR